MTRNRFWVLADRPLPARPQGDTFVLQETEIPKPGPGQALTRTIYVSLDPYQWYYKQQGIEPAGLPCHARTVSQVIESRMDEFTAGDFVFNTNGWAEYGLMGDSVWRPGYMVPRRLDPSSGRISQAVGVLGMLGLTAYAGMDLMASPQAGETVVVSAASGGVGQIAGQLAKQRDARVVGIAGRSAKCEFVADELGFDACVSHLSSSLPADLAAACPDGVDVYFENVGGKVFEAVLPLFNEGARMTICGLIAHYGEDASVDSRAVLMKLGEPIFKARSVIVKNLSVGDFAAKHDEMLAYVGPLVAAGKVRYREDIRQGLEVIPTAFAEMLRGNNFGKMLVQLSRDPTLEQA
ncbi:NADP-dependent oxidoreductase [Bradyrhizobium yuanmingense]|uniref:NADP-dependent oxidoreductase n=1 Tax=Bradyrhizobium yuanmingense TaxID=108015 RepID=UPI0023B9578B|nr:NADP-dependent oxidoreductase [Bradyrhizobium yuanmingense]MDF0498641.1 NADP-dependent oxidoreductase [Bradyrhizobium yuanmingense]